MPTLAEAIVHATLNGSYAGEPSPGADVAGGEPSPGADVQGESPVPVPMWQG